MLQSSACSHGRAVVSSTRPCGARLNINRLRDSRSNLILRGTLIAGAASRYGSPPCLERTQWRSVVTKSPGPAASLAKPGRKLNTNLLHTPNPLAKALRDTGVWDGAALNKAILSEEKALKGRAKRGTGKAKGKADKPAKKDTTSTKGDPATKRGPKGDKSRVHITNEELVDDMIKYLKTTLKRHQGCDLISVYPGAGVWTKALHKAVKPRSHLLLEPDEAIYRPFLQPLLDQENVRLVPKSGIVWEDVNAVLTPEYLPEQVPFDRKTSPDGPPRNDTLLVTLNLAMFPKKRFHAFQSVSRMVLFQLLQTIRTSTLYQKYGQVRMLIWVPDDEKSGILPRVLAGRRRGAIEGEMTTEYIAEVCGRDIATEDANSDDKHAAADRRNLERWPQMDLESARLCKIRMKKGKMVTPPGRTTTVMTSLESYIAKHPGGRKRSIPVWDLLDPVSGKSVAIMSEFRELLKQHKKIGFTSDDPNFLRLKALEQYLINRDVAFKNAAKYCHMQDAVVEAHQAAAAAQAKDPASETTATLLAKARELEVEFDAYVPTLPKYLKEYNFIARDAVHILMRQPEDLGPVLSWDRRPYEPLPATAADFFPNVPCALLDIQPKSPHPLVRSTGPGTDNAGDFFDMILGVLTDLLSGRVDKQFGVLWPGAGEAVLPQCKTLFDPARGGIPLTGAGSMTNRCLNHEQLIDILQEFMKWPFRPSHAELLGRLANEEAIDDDLEMNYRGNATWQNP